MESFRKFSPALYLLIIFCFLLPFFNLSCNGQKVMNVTGLQIITGDEYKQQNMFGGTTKTIKINSEPLAIFAFLAAIVGLVVGFLKIKYLSLFNVIISVVGAVLLFMLKNKIDNDVISEGNGMIEIGYGFGYWASLLLFMVSAVIQGLIYNQGKRNSL